MKVTRDKLATAFPAKVLSELVQKDVVVISQIRHARNNGVGVQRSCGLCDLPIRRFSTHVKITIDYRYRVKPFKPPWEPRDPSKPDYEIYAGTWKGFVHLDMELCAFTRAVRTES